MSVKQLPKQPDPGFIHCPHLEPPPDVQDGFVFNADPDGEVFKLTPTVYLSVCASCFSNIKGTLLTSMIKEVMEKAAKGELNRIFRDQQRRGL